jgi:hypothetical protein
LIIEPIFHHQYERAIALPFGQKAIRPVGRGIRMQVIKTSRPIFQPLFAVKAIVGEGNTLLLKRKTAALSCAAVGRVFKKLTALFRAQAGL